MESEDVDQLDTEDPEAVAVAVATDVPVHLGLVGAIGDATLMSPFIVVSQALGIDRAKPVVDKAHKLRALREHLFPGVRRARRSGRSVTSRLFNPGAAGGARKRSVRLGEPYAHRAVR